MAFRKNRVPWMVDKFHIPQYMLDKIYDYDRLRPLTSYSGKQIGVDTQSEIYHHRPRAPMPYNKFLAARMKREGKFTEL